MNWQDVKVKKREPFPKIGDYVDAVLEDIAEKQNGDGLPLILTLWGAIVGDRVAAVARPTALVHGELTLRVRSAVWRQELHGQSSSIIEAIRDKLPDIDVQNIIFR